jgi:hypothetical protein
MAKIIPITEHFQHFLAEMKLSAAGAGDLFRPPLKPFCEAFRPSGNGRLEEVIQTRDYGVSLKSTSTTEAQRHGGIREKSLPRVSITQW